LISGLATIAVNQLVIMPSFVELERQQAERNTSRAAEAIQRDLAVLSTNVTAWAQWDDSKLFVEGANPAFVDDELRAEAVASAEVSYMGFYKLSGEQVIHRAPGAEAPGSRGLGELQAPALPAHHPLLRLPSLRSDVKGLLATPSGPLLVASRPIVDSSGESAPAGVLIFGRLLDDATRDRIADQYKLDLQLAPADPAREKATDGAVDLATRPAVRLRESGATVIGETTVLDLHGAPIVTLLVRTPRAISERGAEASRIALVTLGAVALAVLGVTLGVINVTVLSPIARLTEHAVELGRSDSLVKRLALARRDELGVLAAEFDRMTDSLGEARQRLIDQSFVFGKAEMAGGILHNLGNAVTPIIVRLNSILERCKAAPSADLERAIAELDAGAARGERRADLDRFVRLAGLELASIVQESEEHVRGAVLQVEHVQQILGEQERFSRAGAVVDSVDVCEIATRVAEGLSPELRALVTLELDASAREIGLVRGPRVELQQVVGNLILNAAESIKSHCITNGRIRVSAQREGDRAHFRIEDNGAGIAPSALEQMFLRRFSTKQRGSGVGLHWSANAVSTMGGAISAESGGPGQGATLHLVLPLATDTTPAAPPEPVR
jgi:signal transduction histidine kinase